MDTTAPRHTPLNTHQSALEPFCSLSSQNSVQHKQANVHLALGVAPTASPPIGIARANRHHRHTHTYTMPVHRGISHLNRSIQICSSSDALSHWLVPASYAAPSLRGGIRRLPCEQRTVEPPVGKPVAYSVAGGMPETAPCFSWAYFLRTACKLLVGAFLCSAFMSRTHGTSAASV